jgi:hypothetical protein
MTQPLPSLRAACGVAIQKALQLNVLYNKTYQNIRKYGIVLVVGGLLRKLAMTEKVVVLLQE